MNTTMTKTLLLNLFALLFTSHGLARNCVSQLPSILICEYDGQTGLELIDGSIELAHLQRQAFNFKKQEGSVVLVTDATVDGLKYNECWSTATKADVNLLLYCSQKQTSRGELPTLILDEIDRLRAN